MINNNFRLMGTAVSDFVEVKTKTQSQFKKYRIMLEIENTKGVDVVPVDVFSLNNRVDTSLAYIGHYIMIEGYIKSMANEINGTKYYNISLVMSSLDVLDSKFKNVTMAGNGYQSYHKKEYQQQNTSKPQQQTQSDPAIDIIVNDDDLPF